MPTEGIFERKLGVYRDLLSNLIGRQSPVTHEQFLSYYRGPRLATYERAVESLRHRALKYKDSFLQTFVKAEKINLSLKADPVPRVIQPRSPRFNVELGCFLRPIEKKIYKKIDVMFGSPTIMSEYNAYDLASILHTKWSKN